MRELDDSDAWTNRSTRTSFQTCRKSVLRNGHGHCDNKILASKSGAINMRHPHKIDRRGRKCDMRCVRRLLMCFNTIPEKGFFPVSTLRDHNFRSDERLEDLKTPCHRPFQTGMGRFGCAVWSAVCSKISVYRIHSILDT